MAQVSRSTFSTNLATLINDNSVEDVTPAEVRSIFTDLEDSAGWYDEVVNSIPTGIAGADRVTNIVSLTQAEYDAISSPNASTIYFITD
jgi:hypothetical protein